MLGRALHLAVPVGNAQLAPQRWLQRTHGYPRVGQRRGGFAGQQGSAITGGHQALDRIVVVELDARRGLLSAQGEPLRGLLEKANAEKP